MNNNHPYYLRQRNSQEIVSRGKGRGIFRGPRGGPPIGTRISPGAIPTMQPIISFQTGRTSMSP